MLDIKKKYGVIYLDPPWSYGSKNDNTVYKHVKGKLKKKVMIKYPTMTIKQLKELDIRSISEKDSIMFMWTTSAHLPNAIDLMTHWGWKYKTIGFCWSKIKKDGNPLAMAGWWTMGNIELCLIGTRGACRKYIKKKNIRQLVQEQRREHSRKPNTVRKRIEEMFPDLNKIELFARTQTPGWDVWGNETDKF